MNLLSSHCFPLTTIEKKPICYPYFFYVPDLQEPEKDQFLAAKKTQKRKYNDGEGAEESGISTELSLYCGTDCSSMIMKKKKPRISEISSTSDKKFLLDSITPSTELTLFDESWIANSVFQNLSATSGKREESDVSKESLSEKLKRNKLAQNIAKMRVYSDEEERKEKRKGVSTELKLFDPWNIKKKLTGSDLGNLTRLLVPSDLVKNYVLCFLNTELVDKIEKEGAKLVIWDCDTETEHHLVFKRWHTSKSYVFIDGWIQYFKNRRNLRKGDLIGIYWDLSESRFNFSVLQRAAM